VIRRDADGDHVLLDELAVMDAGVVPARHEIDSAFIGRDIEHHVRIGARKRTEFRSQHRRRRERRYDEAHAARRLIAPAGDFPEGGANIRERRSQRPQQLLPRVSWRHAPRRSREQPDTNLLFEAADSVAQSGLRNVEVFRGLREAPLFRHGQEG